jgi:hypothetical protein
MSALALVAMTALLMSGICVLTTSNAIRQRREADYALAMQLAEAGANFELQYISAHLNASPNGHLSSNPYTNGTVPGVSGTFSVFVRNIDGTTNWTAPKDAQIVSTGTVGGISRTVTVNCKGVSSSTGTRASIFNGKYALFGYSDVTFSGASSAITGDLGTNGSLMVKAGGNGTVNGYITLCGPFASMSGSISGQGVKRLTAPEAWPTVDTIVNGMFPNGWNDLTSSAAIAAQSARMRTYASNSPVTTVAGTKPIGWTSKTSLTNSDFNTLGVNTLILPPGDYYFTDISISGQAKIVFDTAAVTVPNGVPGQVRIWMNNSSSQDTINADVTFTKGSDPSMFRIYYNKPSDISLSGNSIYYGGIYGVRAGASTSITKASVTIPGGSKITGMVIFDSAKLTGGGVVNGVPGAQIANADDFAIVSIYGFNYWKEIGATQNGRVFSDGTNR